MTPDQRFWSYVQKLDCCWLWTGAHGAVGHGQFYLRHDGGRRITTGAHRFSWEMHRGPIPAGLSVLHNCPGGDNPACVNPDHLFLGTQKDNIQDAARKGRLATGDRSGARTHPERFPRGEQSGPHLHPESLARGSRNGQARTTEADVCAIRALHAAGDITLAAVGQRYNLTAVTVWNIVHRKTWTHVP